MDARLRSSAAHVLVADLDVPEPDDAVAHHLRRVLRLRDGEAMTATDGRGRWRPCRMRNGALAADGPVESVPPPSSPLTVAVAVPKGDRAELLVQKCTEVGVDRIVLLNAERSVVRWDEERATRHGDRLRRVAAEAAMQSRRVWLPELAGPVAATSVLPAAVAGEPGGRPLGPGDTTVAIGPEGGWTEAELATAGGRVTLGPHVLRVETAAVVAAALMVALRIEHEAIR
jgi:16S rRNA (uracil1498-N3)-methyltransferase